MSLGWMVVVLLVGGATFAVVSHAGSQVGEASALRSAAAAVPASPSATGSTTSPSSATPTPTPTASPSAPSSSPPHTSRPPSTSRPRASTPAAPPTPRKTATPPATRTASFTTVGGTVTASCTGTTVRRLSITARDGWRFEEDASSRKLEVHFSRSGRDAAEGASAEDSGDEVELKITCVGGVPTRDSH